MTKRRVVRGNKYLYVHSVVLDLPYANRLSRKAIPTGCGRAWWYLEQNGDIAIYGSEPNFSCVIKARSLKAVKK